MKLSASAAATSLLASASAVLAFSDSSPFVLFSTAELDASALEHNVLQLQTAGQAMAAARAVLASCPTDRYLLVSQPNMHADDIRSRPVGTSLSSSSSSSDLPGCGMPNLCRAVSRAAPGSGFSVAEVVGQVSAAALSDAIDAACRAARTSSHRGGGDGDGNGIVTIERAELEPLPSLRGGSAAAAAAGSARANKLADNDHALGQLLDGLAGGDYTVVLFSDPNEQSPYEPDFGGSVPMDLRRRAEPVSSGGGLARRAADSKRTLPLFEKYQFFTPGVFMGFLATIIMLSILGAGLTALSSLEVSYGAFDKVMGPSAQKKQM